MKQLRQIEKLYWENYLSTLSLDQQPENPYVTASFAGNKDITDDLLLLYLKGRKTAGSSIVEDFLTAGDPLPKVGNYWIFLNGKGEPSCILFESRKLLDIFERQR